jgi:hypothetical protein
VLDRRPDRAAFVRDGLAWRFAGFVTVAGGPANPGGESPVPVVDALDLQDRLLDEIRRPEEMCTYFTDHHAPRGIRREFVGCVGGVEVALARFEDDAAALTAAEGLVGAELADAPPTAGDLAAIEGIEDTTEPADLERWAASYRPSQEAPVPGVAGALGVLRFCSVDGCDAASAFGVRDGVLVRVDVEFSDPDMADAGAILRDQLERI